LKNERHCFYLIGKFDAELLLLLLLLFVTTVAFVNDAKKFDVNCDASALISIAETLISGPTKKFKFQNFIKKKIDFNLS
jgi:hypothetical protein